MKISGKYYCLRVGFAVRATALVASVALLAGMLMPIAAQQKAKLQARRLTEDQRIVHVLNRLGFGARPGDIERVKSIGLESYINQQLNPEKISDVLVESKVKDLTVLNMQTAELYEKYPQPGQLLRQLQARGVLPLNLVEARDNRVKGGANAASVEITKNGDSMEKPNDGEMKVESADAAKKNPATPGVQGNPLDNEKYRQLIRDYYQQ